MNDRPPPSYDDAITGNFSDAPPPPPSSDAEISVSTSFLGPDRYNVPETIVPFPSSPEPAASSLPPSPGHHRENLRVTTPRISPTTTVNNRRSPSPTVVTTNNDGSSKQKSRCIKIVAFIVFILIGIGVLYFVLSGKEEEPEYADYGYDYEKPKVYEPRTTTTTTPRPSSPDDCKTKPPQIVEKRGFGEFQNCPQNHKGEYYNKTTCVFKCSHRYVLSTSASVLDQGSQETRIEFTCVRSEWIAPGDKKDQKINCLTMTELIQLNIG